MDLIRITPTELRRVADELEKAAQDAYEETRCAATSMPKSYDFLTEWHRVKLCYTHRGKHAVDQFDDVTFFYKPGIDGDFRPREPK